VLNFLTVLEGQKMKSVSTYKDEADAYAQIEEAGYHAVPMNFSALKNDYHWHDFDSLIYITKGELTITEQESGESRTCGPGSKIIGTAGLVHREQSEGYSAILGFAVDPRSLSQPVDKPVSASH
jgi:hypothetical protein